MIKLIRKAIIKSSLKTGQEYTSNLITSWTNQLVLRRCFIIGGAFELDG